MANALPMRWRRLRDLGSGRQASVVAVADSTGQLTGEYALKLLNKQTKRVAFERFEREIAAIGRLDHPLIPKVVDFSTDTDRPYYVTELVPGAKSLKELMQSNSNPFHGNIVASLELVRSLFDVISTCAQNGVIHRDLSPGNILVLPDRTIRVIDFGLCQIADHEPVTLLGEGVGTQNYMSPECEAGSVDDATQRSDIYSAGKIAWSAITNQVAFSREQPAFTTKSMKQLFPDSPLVWHLQRVFENTIRHKPDDRWGSAATARMAVEEVQSIVDRKLPPIDKMLESCPICGFGKLQPFEFSHCVFGNPNPEGIVSLQCTECAICFPRSNKNLLERIRERSQLS